MNGVKKRNYKDKKCFTCKKIYKPTTGNNIFCKNCYYNIKCLNCKKYFFGIKKRKYCSFSCGINHPSWNRELTKETDIRVKKNGISIKKYFDKKVENNIKLFESGFNIFNWEQINKHIKIRYKKCQICNKKNKITTHHIDKNRNNNRKNNLMFICYKCHTKHHPENIEIIRNCNNKRKAEKHQRWLGFRSIYCLNCNKRKTIHNHNHEKKRIFCSTSCHYKYKRKIGVPINEAINIKNFSI